MDRTIKEVANDMREAIETEVLNVVTEHVGLPEWKLIQETRFTRDQIDLAVVALQEKGKVLRDSEGIVALVIPITLAEAKRRYKSWTKGILTYEAKKSLTESGKWTTIDGVICFWNSKFALAFRKHHDGGIYSEQIRIYSDEGIPMPNHPLNNTWYKGWV